MALASECFTCVRWLIPPCQAAQACCRARLLARLCHSQLSVSGATERCSLPLSRVAKQQKHLNLHLLDEHSA